MSKAQVIAKLVEAGHEDLAEELVESNSNKTYSKEETDEIYAASEEPMEDAPIEVIKTLKSIGLTPKSYFDGIHGKIIYCTQNNISGQMRLDIKDLAKLTKIKGFRWLGSSGASNVSIGF